MGVQTNDNNEKGVRAVKLHEQLKNDRTTWDGHWDEVAKYVIPRKDDVYGQAVNGEKKTNVLFDTKAIKANDDLSSALHGMLTNPSIIWFGLSTGDEELDNDEEVKKWLFDSTIKTISTMNQSNFQTEIHEVYQDLGSIGTASMRIEEDEDDIVRYYSEPIYEVVLRPNNKGRIDFVSREFEFDGRQVMMEYEDTMDDEAQKFIEDSLKANPNTKFKIIQQVSKRTKAEMNGQVGSKGFPIASIHILKKNGMILRESGFEVWPYATPRSSKINKETYGRSPAMKTLADIKMANGMKKVTIQGAQLTIAPPMQGPDNGFLTPTQFKPFGMNYYRSGSKDRLEPIFTGGNPQLGLDLLQDVHNSIREHFMLDKLVLPLQDRMTATETLQRRDENLRHLGPQLGRMDTELLKPIIDRTVFICGKRGVYDELPAKLAEKGDDFTLNIVYRSTIAQAQMIAQSENIVRAINSTAFVVGSQPEVMDNIDGDKLLQKNFTTYNVDPDILRSKADVDKIRKDRAEAIRAQQQSEQSNQDAQTVKTLEDANGQGNAS